MTWSTMLLEGNATNIDFKQALVWPDVSLLHVIEQKL